MIEPEFIAASVQTHREALIAINVEYVDWVFGQVEALFDLPRNQLVGMSASHYVPTVIDKVCGDAPPSGVFYLVMLGPQLAGMGGLRRLRPGVAEVKRLYIRPQFRGHKLGELLLRRVLSDARAFGYERACLDTALFMRSAHRLYENHGFVDCPAYEGTEVPPAFQTRWRFMTRAL
ncbi:GNAT family N-acetyltransferase [Roseateles toxinivorans]|uniref:Acetyltransferase (GNAT) family protein n=1 Tax=Roseateles toxinivorans TaxID=270368 RepID=A0A4V3CTV2_9BURK|nr:GNAT family N-acetyltransferase [Roseateles toxinivorans]TDP74288.1 acetyltransferase (GNAT) family protein [Roseateles toxinivorans]